MLLYCILVKFDIFGLLFSSVHTEILVIGTGGRTERVDPKVLALMKAKGIAVEVQDTVSRRPRHPRHVGTNTHS